MGEMTVKKACLVVEQDGGSENQKITEETKKLAKPSNNASALSVESDRAGSKSGLSQEASQLPNGGDQSRGKGSARN